MMGGTATGSSHGISSFRSQEVSSINLQDRGELLLEFIPSTEL